MRPFELTLFMLDLAPAVGGNWRLPRLPGHSPAITQPRGRSGVQPGQALPGRAEHGCLPGAGAAAGDQPALFMRSQMWATARNDALFDGPSPGYLEVTFDRRCRRPFG